MPHDGDGEIGGDVIGTDVTELFAAVRTFVVYRHILPKDTANATLRAFSTQPLFEGLERRAVFRYGCGEFPRIIIVFAHFFRNKIFGPVKNTGTSYFVLQERAL